MTKKMRLDKLKCLMKSGSTLRAVDKCHEIIPEINQHKNMTSFINILLKIVVVLLFGIS